MNSWKKRKQRPDQRGNIQLVILAMEPDDRSMELSLARILLKQPVKMAGAVHLFEELDGAIPYQALDERYLLGFEAEVRKKSYLKVKRIFDIVFSLSFLIVLSPIFLAAAVWSRFLMFFSLKLSISSFVIFTSPQQSDPVGLKES